MVNFTCWHRADALVVSLTRHVNYQEVSHFSNKTAFAVLHAGCNVRFLWLQQARNPKQRRFLMDYGRLGNSNLRVSVLCLGVMMFGGQT
jgi:hypothetical protein